MDFEDYVDILRRHANWIVGPLFAGLVISVVVAFLWPDTYVSEAIIRFTPPKVPEKYVSTNVNTQADQRINAMAQTILSRTNLEDTINALGLYPSKRNRVPIEDIIEDMRKDIKIVEVTPLRTQESAFIRSTAFRIQFAYQDRFLAQKVVQKIVRDFLDQNITDRDAQSKMTTEFLADATEAAKRDLDNIEAKLTAYKMAHAGTLPDQLEANYQQMRTLEARLESVNASINRVTQDKLNLESSLRIFREQRQALAAAPSSPVESAVANERLLALEKQILSLEANLTAMRQHYRESHPDVQRTEAELASAKNRRDEMLAEERKRSQTAAAKKADTTPINTPQARELEANIQRAQDLIRAKESELQQYVKEQVQIQDALKRYQQRIESVPLAERDYIALLREYNLAKQRYDDLSMKKANSQLATDLEVRNQGESLELIDVASLPKTPTEPKRWLIILLGTLLGLVVGLFLAGGREIRDTSLKNLKDVRAYTNLAILGSVPLLENDLVVKRKRRLVWLAWSSATIVGFLVMIGSVYYYYTKSA